MDVAGSFLRPASQWAILWGLFPPEALEPHETTNIATSARAGRSLSEPLETTSIAALAIRCAVASGRAAPQYRASEVYSKTNVNEIHFAKKVL